MALKDKKSKRIRQRPPTPEELFPYEDWQQDVALGDTKLGYKDWVEHNMEAVEMEAVPKWLRE
jgi:hypothetical protein